MEQLIVTHPGRAHFDECFAAALILAAHPEDAFRIERRSPAEDELQDPAVWVLDIGGRHEPQRLNFDHHQDLDLEVTFVLVARHLDLENLLSPLPWWDYKDRLDRFGPTRVAAELGAASLAPTVSPIEEWILERFAADPMGMAHLLRRFGAAIIAQARQRSERLAFWRTCCRVNVAGKQVLVGLTEDSTALEEFCSQADQHIDAAVIHDIRGDGWKLRRFDHATGIDFSRLEGHPEIRFAHKGGFIAKTRRRLPLDQVLALVARAVG